MTDTGRTTTNRQKLIGSASNILLLGFLAGVYAGYTMPAQTMYWVARLTIAGFAVSVVITLIKGMLAIRVERKAIDHVRTVVEKRIEPWKRRSEPQ